MPSYSALAPVRQLIELMHAHAISRCVLCPGSRNSPILSSLAEHPEMECRAATDERSGAFMALGWASQAQSPVAIIVTSGSALLNAHPAIAEAYYRNIPLLLISADRPAAWIGQQDGQTLPQQGSLSSMLRGSYSLPESDSPESLWHRNRLINEALLELRHRGSGPVHINIPLSEPLFERSESPLEPQRVIHRCEFALMSGHQEEQLINRLRAQPRRMILVGQCPLPPQLSETLMEKGFVIVAEQLGNCAGIPGVINNPDQVLGRDCPAELAPDLIISLGGCIISKRIKRLLREHPAAEHWHISPDGAIIDTFRCLRLAIEGSQDELWDLIEAFAEDMEPESPSCDYFQAWQQRSANHALAPLESQPYAAARLVGEFIASLPLRASLHLANSMSVRLAQLYPLPPEVIVDCNRGCNGIEGSLSSAIGYAASDDKPNYLVIGDLSFFYDMNALSLPCLSPNLCILLLNNSGGAIFDALPGLDQHSAGHRYISAQHKHSAQGWAESCGLRYIPVHNINDWEAHALPALEARASADQPPSCPLIIETFTTTAEDAQSLRDLLR